MIEPVTTVSAILLISNKLLGKTADIVASDIASLYEQGRNKIINIAARKIPNIDDGKIANLRVTRDVFFNGSFTDDSICAEYFGGILASSRSLDGKDDSGVFYADIIKSLSSSQLRLHYIIYNSLNELWFKRFKEEEMSLNVGKNSEVTKNSVFFLTNELEKLDIDIGRDILAIESKKLISFAETFNNEAEKLRYARIVPTTLGIQLYAVANNKLLEWRKFPIEDFGKFPEIKLPFPFSLSRDDFLIKVKDAQRA
ncbi:MAG: hypothetical protein PHN56_06225 [Candidatus Nanoarchaeia archaeon]|nr:hypothetical protein [Candidatus Nanoarchaeia archaeon]